VSQIGDSILGFHLYKYPKIL